MSSTGSNIKSAVPKANDVIDLASIGKDKKNLLLAMESISGKTINTETEYSQSLNSLFGKNKNVMTATLNIMGNTSLSKDQRSALLKTVASSYQNSKEGKADQAKLKADEIREQLKQTTDKAEIKKLNSKLKQAETDATHNKGIDESFDSDALVEVTKAKNLDINTNTSIDTITKQLSSNIKSTSRDFYKAKQETKDEQKNLETIKNNTLKETQNLLNADFDKAETLSYKDDNGYTRKLKFNSAAEMTTLASNSGMSGDDIIKNMQLVNKSRSGETLTDKEQVQLDLFKQDLTNAYKNMSADEKSMYKGMSKEQRAEALSKAGKQIAETKSNEAVQQKQKEIRDAENEKTKLIQNDMIRTFSDDEDVKLNEDNLKNLDKKYGFSKLSQEDIEKLEYDASSSDVKKSDAAIKKLDQFNAWSKANTHVKEQTIKDKVTQPKDSLLNNISNSAVSSSKDSTKTTSNNATKEDTITTKKEVYNSSTGRIEESQKNNPQTTTTKSDNTKSQTSGGGEDKQIVINLIVNGETIQQLAKSVKNLEANAAG